MTDQTSIQIVGPYATEYSLAKVNRSLAKAIKSEYPQYKIHLWGDQGNIDRQPNADDLKKYPWLKGLYKIEKTHTDITIFNSFPKSPTLPYGLKEIDADIKLAYLAWEESIFPTHFVKECNEHLHGIMVTSDHVLNVFRDSGIMIPMVNVSGGMSLDPDEVVDFKIDSKRKFKFLHISSGHYRKGLDVLLKAYFQEFKNTDDVVLVLKLFPNPDNEVEELIHNLQKDDSPKVEIINRSDLSDGQITSLYHQCDAVVLPSRAEGFGLPMAEAMLMQTPLITTGYSGHMDFCNTDNCHLIKYKIADSQSHLNIPGSKVAEPDQEDLQAKMRYIFKNIESEAVKESTNRAYEEVRSLTWKKTAQKIVDFVKFCQKIHHLKKKKMAVITPINTVGGLAEYSKNFYSKIENSFKKFKYFANEDAGGVIGIEPSNICRTWESNELSFTKTVKEILKYEPDIVHIQYNPPLYPLQSLASLIKTLSENQIEVYLTPHSVQIDYVDYGKYLKELSLCKIFYLHSELDLKFLSNKGFTNLQLFNYGLPTYRDEDSERLKRAFKIDNHPIIASHGMIHDKKGLIETIEALRLLKEDYPEILLLCVNAINRNNVSSSAVYEKMKKLVKKHKLQRNVLFFTDFLNNKEIMKLLHLSSLTILPYPDLKESASGAVRKCIAASRPVVITQSHIFSGITVGYRIKTNEPALVASAVKELLSNPEMYRKEKEKVMKYNKENSWEKASKDYLVELSESI